MLTRAGAAGGVGNQTANEHFCFSFLLNRARHASIIEVRRTTDRLNYPGGSETLRARGPGPFRSPPQATHRKDRC